VLLQVLESGRTIADIERAATAGDREALYLLAVAKLEGAGGVAVDQVGARSLLRQAVFKGFPRASLSYGSMLFFGEGGPKAVEEAVGWWTSAAEAGYAPASYQLGNYYAFSAPEAERSFAKALPHFERAAATGHSRAQVAVLDYDWYGRDRPKNPGSALAGYQQLAASGNLMAAVRLAEAYRHGTNVAKDAPRSLALYRRAADGGSADAAAALGLWLAEGADGVAADPATAARYLLRASRANDAQSSAMLAKLLINGTAPPIDGVDRVALAVSADERGYPEGLGALTANLREGKNGWEKDLPRAASYARPAYRRALARPLDSEGAWPLHTRGFAYTIQVALADGVPAESPTELADLDRQWGLAGRGMKRFTVPADFNGVSHPFQVYIWDAPEAPVPTDAQFDWVLQARGGRVGDDVRESFRKLFKIARDNNVSFQDLAVYALNAAQQDQASAAARAAPEQLRSAREKLTRSDALARENKLAEALELVNASIAEVPQATAFMARGMLHDRMGDKDAALADYDAAARDTPSLATAQNARCWMRATANRELEVAHTACDTALRLQPNNGAFLDSHGLVLFRLGRFQESRTEYDKAVRVEPRNAGFLYGRGMASLRLGRTAEGQADLAAAAAIDPAIAKTYADFGVGP